MCAQSGLAGSAVFGVAEYSNECDRTNLQEKAFVQ